MIGRTPAFYLPLLVLCLTACTAPKTRYYSLVAEHPSPVVSTASSAPPVANTPLYVELAPLAIPERLARPQLVIRPAGAHPSEVLVLEQHRWAASFESELRDALSATVAKQLGALDTTRGTRQSGQVAWRIAVLVREFDAAENQHTRMALSWTLRRTDSDRNWACQWSATESVQEGVEALAAGAQRLTAAAAQAIAQHVQSAIAGVGSCPG